MPSLTGRSGLSRFAITAIALATAAYLAMKPAEAAAGVVADTQGAELVSAAPPGSRAPSLVADTAALPEPEKDALLANHAAAAGLAGSWFAASELDPNALREKSGMGVDPGCLEFTSEIHGFAAGNGDCRLFTPSVDKRPVFTLPLLAGLGWVLAILAVAGGYYLNRHWRTRLWLRQLRAQGVVLQPIHPRDDHGRRASRSRSRKRSASRSHAA